MAGTHQDQASVNTMPKGIPYIIMNEAAERFSFYGMKQILAPFMTIHMLDSAGNLDTIGQNDANVWIHIFTMAVYFTPILGAIVSDVFWGKYKTIMRLSIVYCLGHLTLAIFETKFGLAVGLSLIAIGSGGIKPCVSAHVGDQFDEKRKHLIEKVFAYFYFSINLGAFISTALTPWLLEHVGPHVAFGLPGALMFLATFVFWLGRKKFIAIKNAGVDRYKKDVFGKEGLGVIGRLSILYVFIAVFWSLFDQTGTSWYFQAEKLDRMIDLRFAFFDSSWLQFEILPAQVGSANPILILLFVPLFTFIIYPLIARIGITTPLRKITTGLFLASASFVIIAGIESFLEAGHTVSVFWQLLAYAVLTAGEVMVSITALEYSYTQSPNTMKSFIMGLWLLSVALGNAIAAFVNFIIQRPDGTFWLEGPSYFLFFAGLMFATAVGFIFVAMFQKEKTYIQDKSDIIDPIVTEN